MPEQSSERNDGVGRNDADVPAPAGDAKNSPIDALASSDTRDDLPELQEDSQQVTRLNASYSETRIYQGPLPDPKLLKGYEHVLPGSAKQIVDTFVDQSAHRRGLEKNQQWHNNARSWGGMVCGFVLCCGVLGVSAYMVAQDHSVAALATVITSMSVLAGVFVFGKKAQVDQLRGAQKQINKHLSPTKDKTGS